MFLIIDQKWNISHVCKKKSYLIYITKIYLIYLHDNHVFIILFYFIHKCYGWPLTILEGCVITQKNQCLISQGFFFSDLFFTLLFVLAGEKLYDSAFRFRMPNFPAFALECLPNRNSLVYGKLYGIEDEASTIFRGTLRYEGITCLWILQICII